MPTPREIGVIFSEARKTKNLSIPEAARKSRILEDVIRDIENGIFDRLGKPYVKGFLRKYADFLGIDPEVVINKYNTISSEIPSKELDFGQDPSKNKLDVLTGHRKRKFLAVLVLSASAFFLAMLLLILSGRPRSPSRTVYGSTGRTVKLSGVQNGEVPSRSDKNSGEGYELVLRATDEVWVQVKRSEKTFYAGIMQKGDSRVFYEDAPLTVLTGRGEALEFTFNGEYAGFIARGVVKDITVSAEGIRVGTKWAVRSLRGE